jgi:hypothetical protein
MAGVGSNKIRMDTDHAEPALAAMLAMPGKLASEPPIHAGYAMACASRVDQHSLVERPRISMINRHVQRHQHQHQ